jgi:hypothetical protein
LPSFHPDCTDVSSGALPEVEIVVAKVVTSITASAIDDILPKKFLLSVFNHSSLPILVMLYPVFKDDHLWIINS